MKKFERFCIVLACICGFIALLGVVYVSTTAFLYGSLVCCVCGLVAEVCHFARRIKNRYNVYY